LYEESPAGAWIDSSGCAVTLDGARWKSDPMTACFTVLAERSAAVGAEISGTTAYLNVSRLGRSAWSRVFPSTWPRGYQDPTRHLRLNAYSLIRSNTFVNEVTQLFFEYVGDTIV